MDRKKPWHLRLLSLFAREEIAADKEARRAALQLLLAGVLLRLLLMPFSAHNDFLSEHIRAEYMAFSGRPFAVTGQFLSHWIDAFFLIIFSPLLPDHAIIFALPGQTGSSSTAGNEAFAAFLASPAIYRTLFLLKLPYLLTDIFCALLLLKLVDDKKDALWAFGLWVLNPVSLYSIYAFGRFETYAVALLLASLLMAKRGRAYLSSLLFGLAIASRSYMLMFVPFFSIALCKRWQKALASLAISIAPVAVYALLANTLTGGPFFYRSTPTTNVLSSLAEGGFVGLALVPRIPLDRYHIYLLPLVFIVIYLLFLSSRERGYGAVLKGLSALALSYFILAPFSIHWFLWLVPFLALLLSQNRDLRWAAWAIFPTWLVYGLFYSDWSTFTPYLFSPIHPQFFMVRPSLSIILQDLIKDLGPATKDLLAPQSMLGLSRTLLSALLLWVMFRATKPHKTT